MAFRVSDELGAAGELVAPFFHAPWRNHLETRRKGVYGELEAHLVIALAGGAVGDGVGSFRDGQIDHGLRDAGAGDGRAEQIAPFIESVGLEHGENVVGGEIRLEIADDTFGGSCRQGFGLQSIQLLRLTYVGAEGDDFGVVLLLEPHQKNGCVKATGVCENDLHLEHCLGGLSRTRPRVYSASFRK